jgi:hypothetical protein
MYLVLNILVRQTSVDSVAPREEDIPARLGPNAGVQPDGFSRSISRPRYCCIPKKYCHIPLFQVPSCQNAHEYHVSVVEYRLPFQNAVARQGLPDQENPFRAHGGAGSTSSYFGNYTKDRPAGQYRIGLQYKEGDIHSSLEFNIVFRVSS